METLYVLIVKPDTKTDLARVHVYTDIEDATAMRRHYLELPWTESVALTAVVQDCDTGTPVAATTRAMPIVSFLNDN